MQLQYYLFYYRTIVLSILPINNFPHTNKTVFFYSFKNQSKPLKIKVNQTLFFYINSTNLHHFLTFSYTLTKNYNTNKFFSSFSKKILFHGPASQALSIFEAQPIARNISHKIYLSSWVSCPLALGSGCFFLGRIAILCLAALLSNNCTSSSIRSLLQTN